MSTDGSVPGSSDELTLTELAARCGVDDREIERLIDARVVVPRDAVPPFRNVDILKVRVARACEEGGLPMDGMAKAIDKGLLSFAFVDVWPFERERARVPQTHAELAEEAGIPFGTLRPVLEAFGFPPIQPSDVVTQTERPIAMVMGQAISLGFVDERGAVRFGNVYAEALRRIAAVETEAYHAGVEMPLLRSGVTQSETMDRAGKLTSPLIGLLGETVLATYRRQQELAWTEHQIEHVEEALEDAGVALPPGVPTAMCFIDLSGYTRFTEERGDEAAAASAARLADIVQGPSRQHRGEAVKWAGDGVMFRFRDPKGAVLSALELVDAIPAAGLPPAHIGVAAGPVIQQGGDFYGRTVNLASRISDRATSGQVLVSERVREFASSPEVSFVDVGAIELKGFTNAVPLFEARRAG
jgi:class 3 adenylate cyclase